MRGITLPISLLVYMVLFTLATLVFIYYAPRFSYGSSLGIMLFKGYNSVYNLFYDSINGFCERSEGTNVMATFLKSAILCPSLDEFLNWLDESVTDFLRVNRLDVIREKAIVIKYLPKNFTIEDLVGLRGSILSSFSPFRFGLFKPKDLEGLIPLRVVVIYGEGLENLPGIESLLDTFPIGSKVIIFGQYSTRSGKVVVNTYYLASKEIPLYFYYKILQVFYGIIRNYDILFRGLITLGGCRFVREQSQEEIMSELSSLSYIYASSDCSMDVSFYSCFSNVLDGIREYFQREYGIDIYSCDSNPESCIAKLINLPNYVLDSIKSKVLFIYYSSSGLVLDLLALKGVIKKFKDVYSQLYVSATLIGYVESSLYGVVTSLAKLAGSVLGLFMEDSNLVNSINDRLDKEVKAFLKENEDKVDEILIYASIMEGLLSTYFYAKSLFENIMLTSNLEQVRVYSRDLLEKIVYSLQSMQFALDVYDLSDISLKDIISQAKSLESTIKTIEDVNQIKSLLENLIESIKLKYINAKISSNSLLNGIGRLIESYKDLFFGELLLRFTDITSGEVLLSGEVEDYCNCLSERSTITNINPIDWDVSNFIQPGSCSYSFGTMLCPESYGIAKYLEKVSKEGYIYCPSRLNLISYVKQSGEVGDFFKAIGISLSSSCNLVYRSGFEPIIICKEGNSVFGISLSVFSAQSKNKYYLVIEIR